MSIKRIIVKKSNHEHDIILKEVDDLEEEMEEIPAGMGDEEYPIPEGKKSKQEFLESKNLHARPNSHMAIKAWEEYNAS